MAELLSSRLLDEFAYRVPADNFRGRNFYNRAVLLCRTLLHHARGCLRLSPTRRLHNEDAQSRTNFKMYSFHCNRFGLRKKFSRPSAELPERRAMARGHHERIFQSAHDSSHGALLRQLAGRRGYQRRNRRHNQQSFRQRCAVRKIFFQRLAHLPPTSRIAHCAKSTTQQ